MVWRRDSGTRAILPLRARPGRHEECVRIRCVTLGRVSQLLEVASMFYGAHRRS
jgi:hypothetical protein